MNAPYQRRIKFIDSRLQGSLIAILILLESLIVIVAMGYLYFDYSALLEEYMYSIHRLGHEDFFLRLLLELVVVVAVMSVFNVVLLLIANRLWVRYIKGIVTCFTHELAHIKRLDLRRRPPFAASHEVLTQLEQWRQRESQRHTLLRRYVSQIMSASTQQRLLAIEDALKVLPKRY